MSKGIGGSAGSSGNKGIGGNVGNKPEEKKGISGNTGSGSSSNYSYSSSSSNSSSSNSKSGGDCFVATAAFGTPWEAEIQVLRDWRDNTLRYSNKGRAFISFYYKRGPIAAKFIRNYPIFKAPIRAVIRLFIKLKK